MGTKLDSMIENCRFNIAEPLYLIAELYLFTHEAKEGLRPKTVLQAPSNSRLKGIIKYELFICV
jgi:hypothetical protein